MAIKCVVVVTMSLSCSTFVCSF